MKKILVAVDFSDLATLVINYAIKQAKAFGSEILILHVEPPVPAYLGNEISPPSLSENLAEEVDRIRGDLDAMVRFVKEKGIGVTYEFIQGPIVDTIVEEASKNESDMIIMGAHNNGFLYRAFIGSISSGVMKISHCSVLIIPEK